jgi:hypothetical protein
LQRHVALASGLITLAANAKRVRVMFVDKNPLNCTRENLRVLAARGDSFEEAVTEQLELPFDGASE